MGGAGIKTSIRHLKKKSSNATVEAIKVRAIILLRFPCSCSLNSFPGVVGSFRNHHSPSISEGSEVGEGVRGGLSDSDATQHRPGWTLGGELEHIV